MIEYKAHPDSMRSLFNLMMVDEKLRTVFLKRASMIWDHALSDVSRKLTRQPLRPPLRRKATLRAAILTELESKGEDGVTRAELILKFQRPNGIATSISKLKKDGFIKTGRVDGRAKYFIIK